MALLATAPPASASFAGTPDPQFGQAGSLIAKITELPSYADSLVLQSDGKLLVGGYGSSSPGDPGSASTAFVARLTPDGHFDPAFGIGGRVVLSDVHGFAPSTVPAEQEVRQFEGVIPARLKVLTTTDDHVLVLGDRLLRLNSDGRRDQIFGTAGIADLPQSFSPAGLAEALDGAIVLVGTRRLSDRVAGAVVRLTSDGHLDPTFGSAQAGTSSQSGQSGDVPGMVTLPQVNDSAGNPIKTVDYRGVVITPAGLLVAGRGGEGTRSGPFERDGLLARLTADGNLDKTFGNGGQTVMPITNGFQLTDGFEPSSLLVRSDGSILVGGAFCGYHAYHPCLPDVNVFTAGGQLQRATDESGGCGPPYCALAVGVTPLADGGVLSRTWEGELVMERLNSGLTMSPTFGMGDTGSDIAFAEGVVASLPPGGQSIGNALVLADGKIVVAGAAPTTDGSAGMLVARVFGLSPSPRQQLTIPRQRARSGARGVSVRLHCGAYVSCVGQATLETAGRVHIAVGSAPFDIAPGASALAVVAPDRRALAALRRRRQTLAVLRISLSDGGVIATRLLIPRLAQVPQPRRGRPGPLQPLASGVAAFASDGRRYIVFEQGGTARVLDTLTQRRYSTAAPTGCQYGTQAPFDVSFPMVLFSCTAGGDSALVNVLTHRQVALPPTTTGPGGQWVAIGRFWVGPNLQPPNCPSSSGCEQYFNWHTGAVHVVDHALARNLDSPSLTPLPACPPFAPTNPVGSLIDRPQLYEPPYLLFGQDVDVQGRPPPGLHLAHCGTPVSITLDTAGSQPASPPAQLGEEIGSRIVTWHDPGSSRTCLYDIARSRRLTWTAPDAPSNFSSPAAIAHTRYSAIVASATHQLCHGPDDCQADAWTLYQAALR